MSAFTTYLEAATRREVPVQAADLLFEAVVSQDDPALLSSIIAALNKELRALPLTAPKSAFSALMRLIMALDERREEAELAADPARRAGIERVGEHFARKAQSGFSALPLPE
jgi:hypothetical protein